MNILFASKEHEERYKSFLESMKSQDVYHQSVAYLLALDDFVGVEENVFNFETDRIYPSALSAGWQTSGSARTTRLMLNLWNGWAYSNSEDEENGVVSIMYAVDNIFCCSNAPYYFEAIKLRFPLYFR